MVCDLDIVRKGTVINMKIKIAFLIAAGIMAINTACLAEGYFKDLEGNKNKAIIEHLAEQGIIEGKTANIFSPKDNVTRAEFSKMVCKAMGYTEYSNVNLFGDVSENDWFASFVNILAEKGIIEGYNGNFYPNDFIKNEEAAKILVELYEKETIGIRYQGTYASFIPDYFDASPWARDYVNKGVMIGAVRSLEYPVDIDNPNTAKRTDVAKFRPKEFMKRDEAAEVIFNVTNAISVTNKYEEEE